MRSVTYQSEMGWDHVIQTWIRRTYMDDFRQVIPRRLLTPEATLKTSDTNQKRFTKSPSLDGTCWSTENWSVVAVTLEKNVAIVVRFRYRVVAFASPSATKLGKTAEMCVHYLITLNSLSHLPVNAKFWSSEPTFPIMDCNPGVNSSTM